MKTYSISIPCRFTREYVITAQSPGEAWDKYVNEPHPDVISEIDDEDVNIGYGNDLESYFFRHLVEEQA